MSFDSLNDLVESAGEASAAFLLLNEFESDDHSECGEEVAGDKEFLPEQKRKPEMSMIRSAVCWPAFGIVAAVAGTAWSNADERGVHPCLSAAAIAQADPPTSRANALTASLTDELRLKGKSVESYSTRFQLNEDPISEGGRWINGRKDGIDWYEVITKKGVACGAVTKGDYTDQTALVKGVWGKNQHGRGKVFSRNQTEKYYQEVEIRCVAR